MSFSPQPDPVPGDAQTCDAIDMMIVPRSVDLGGFEVRRVLPHVERRMVGPYVFFDHFGPAEFKTGDGLDVRPHPHIGLATVTFLYDGEIVHRDSLGSALPIRPGDVNWMTAGRGIVHSERTAPDHRQGGEPLHGLQCWVALPSALEEVAPTFAHHGKAELPIVSGEGKTVRVVSGSLLGVKSPVETLCDTLFADATLTAGAMLPFDADSEERAVYITEGEIAIDDAHFTSGRLLIVRPGEAITFRAVTDARVTLVGGAVMDGPRYVWWNFVSSRKERIDQAKADWRQKRFDSVPGDEAEFIPLPD
jgi:hypothetical protein